MIILKNGNVITDYKINAPKTDRRRLQIIDREDEIILLQFETIFKEDGIK
jgi:hypothetical protein